MLDLHMQVTINSLKKYYEITPVYVSTQIHLYRCYCYFKATKSDKYKINTGYGLLQGIFFMSSHQSRCVGNSSLTFYLHGPDLASYPVTDYFRL
jgi:hypothetical protein